MIVLPTASVHYFLSEISADGCNIIIGLAKTEDAYGSGIRTEIHSTQRCCYCLVASPLHLETGSNDLPICHHSLRHYHPYLHTF